MEIETLNRLRSHLRTLRKAMGFSQEVTAHEAGIDYKFYQSIEAGRRKELRVSTVEKIARAYGLEAYELLAPQVPKPKKSPAKTAAREPSKEKPRKNR